MKKLTKKQQAVLAGHKWRTEMCLDTGDGGTIIAHCKALGIWKRIVTPKRKQHKDTLYNEYETPQVHYGIYGQDEEYDTLAALANALIARKA